MNLYNYVKNNPYRYSDPNGLFAVPLILIPVIEIAFDCIFSWVTTEALVTTAVGAAIGVGVYQLDKALDSDDKIALNNETIAEEHETEKKGRRKGKDNETRGGPLRDQDGNYLPDPAAEGTPHTNLGTRNGSI